MDEGFSSTITIINVNNMTVVCQKIAAASRRTAYWY